MPVVQECVHVAPSVIFEIYGWTPPTYTYGESTDGDVLGAWTLGGSTPPPSRAKHEPVPQHRLRRRRHRLKAAVHKPRSKRSEYASCAPAAQ